MFDCGIGIDCAGFAQAAYLHATGQTRAQARFAGPLDEDLSNLGARGFHRVGTADVRPGDLVVLGPQDPKNPHDVGHRAVVYDARLATASDMRHLLHPDGGDSSGSPVSPVRASFAIGGPVRVIEVDASWGSNGVAPRGGVQRQTWFFNEATGLWASEAKDGDTTTFFGAWPRPYDHPLDGFYRKGS